MYQYINPNRHKYILASASPRRKELLGLYIPGIEIVPPGVDESFSHAKSVEDELMRIAELKASSVAKNNPGAVVIAADTIVVKEGVVYGKPKDENDALNTLLKLRGTSHKVMTGVCAAAPSGGFTFIEKTSVTFRNYDDELIRWYISTGEPFGRAGAYAIQGYGALLADKIEGDYSNVVGLPVARLIYELVERGLFRLQ